MAAIKPRDEELQDIAYVLADKRGRRFMWRLMGICGLYQSVMLTLPAGVRPEERGCYNGARQDIAQGLHTECLEVDKTGQLYQIMMSEAHARKMLADAEALKDQGKPKENADDE